MYVKVVDGSATEYTVRDLRRDYPNVSFPPETRQELLAEYGVYPVTMTPKPVETATQKVKGYSFTGSGTDWTLLWETESKTPQEQAEWEREQEMQADMDILKSDAEVLQLLRARPEQINNYIDNNVNDLAAVKNVLKRVCRASAVLAQTVIN
jgi:hypothetical protein